MTDFPARGQKAPAYWDAQLKAYIDEADATKADSSSTTTALGTKADAAATTAALATKADSSAVTTQLATKADDSVVVKTSGNQTIAGTKTFSSAPGVPDGSFPAAKTTGLEPAQTPATQAEAEAGTVTNLRSFSPLRIKQAIVALASGGGVGGNVQWIQQNSDGSWPAPATTSASVLMFWRGIVGGTAPGDGTTRATGVMLRGVDVWIRVP